VVWVWYNSATQSVSSISDTLGNAYVKAVGPTTGSGAMASWRQELWYAKNTAGGSESVTATFSGSFSTEKAITAHEYAGADPTAPLDGTAAAAVSGTNVATGAVTTTASNELIFGAALFQVAGTAGAGFTQRSSIASNVSEDEAVSASGSYTATFVNGSQAAIVQVATFKAASGGTSPPPTPDLTLTKQHSGSFVQGQTGAAYTLSVRNMGTGATSGNVTVTDGLPSGLTATALTGTGWTCTLASLTCTRADALAAGASYPSITLTVNVATTAPATVTNTATVTGGGDTNSANNAASDPTSITASSSDVTPPSAPTNLSAPAVSASQVTLTWTASTDNVAVAGYRILRGGASVGTSTQTTYTDTGLSPSTTYTYTVVAYDAANNSSAPSQGLSVTTAAVSTGPITFVQLTETKQTATNSSISSGAFASPVTAGHLLVVWVWYNSATQSVATVTDTLGNVYAKAVGPTTGSGAMASWRQELWYAKNSVGGSVTVAATFTGSFAAEKAITAHEYAGADPTAPLDGATGAAVSGTNVATGAVTTTASNELIFGAALMQGAGTAGAGFTQRSSIASNVSEDKVVSTPGSYTATFVNSSQAAIVQMATFKAASGGATPPPTPDLTLTKQHSGSFVQGQTGATYTLSVRNAGTGATSGPVTVTDSLPTGLTATGMSGTGWTCTLSSPTCTRADALAGGASYPSITVTVNVSSTAPATVTNAASVTGGGDTNSSNNSASDPTSIGSSQPPPPPPPPGPITAPLRTSTINPHYFVDGNGNAVYLTGSHTWNSFQDWGTNGSVTPLDFPTFVSFLTAHGHNFTLLWHIEVPRFCSFPTTATSPPEFTVDTHPWQRTGPGTASDGGLKFDLTKFDQSYFDRLRSRVQQLNAAGIYAGVYTFTVEFIEAVQCGDSGYPFNSGNNINGIADSGGFSSVEMTAPNAITAVQDAFVEKVIDTLNDLPNVLWAISEEAPSDSTWWNNHQISHIRAYEASKPFQHPIGYPTLSGGSDSTLYNSNADWVAPVAMISPTSSCGSGSPACKVNVNDSDHSYYGMWNDSAQTNRNFLWENFTNGNQVLFMDPYVVYYPRENRNLCASPVNGICSTPDPRWNNFRDNLGYARTLAMRVNLAAMLPQPGLASTGYALANLAPNAAAFIAYQPASGSFTLNLSSTSRTLSVEWLNPATGTTTTASAVAGGATRTFSPPFSGDAVLFVYDPSLGAPDTTAPSTPTNLSATVISYSQINLSWAASTDNVGVAGYRVFRNGVQVGVTSTTAYSDTGLAAATTYAYAVAAYDAAQNTSPLSQQVSATTAAASDTTPPSAPSNLVSSGVTSNSVTVSWTASTDNVSVAGYRVLRNGAQVGTSVQTTYTDTGVSPSTTYIYTVVAYDAANNASAPSQGLSVTTAAVTSGPITFVQLQENNQVASGSTISTGAAASPVTAGHLLVIWIWYNNATQSVSTVTDTIGNVYAKAVGPTTGTGTMASWRQELWYAKNVAGGTGVSVTATFAGSFAGEKAITAHEYAGADTTAPLDVTAVAAVSGANVSTGTVTTTASNELVFGAALFQAAGAAGAGFTQRSAIANNVSEDKVVSAVGSYAVTFVNSSQAVIAQLATFKAASGTAVPPPSPPSALSVVPRTSVLTPTLNQQFGVSGGSGGTVSWMVDGVISGNPTTGTITVGGLYSPPSQAGSHAVTATDQSGTASATVYVTTYPGTFTHHNDNARTGQNLSETVLTPANVNSSKFGKLFSYTLDGLSIASPLYVAGVSIPGQGVHNVVYIATEHDSVYAFDADGLSTTPLWKVSFLGPNVTTVPASDTGETGDISPEIGITGTPVIDPASNTLYVVAKTKEGGSTYVQRLHALDLGTGAEKFAGPVTIQATVPGSQVAFDPLRQNQRPALLMNNGVVYLAFGSHGDQLSYYGWVLGYNASTLQQVFVVNVSPNAQAGGIWMANGGPAADASGNIYVVTGNGPFDANTGGNDFGDSFLRITPSGTIADYFTPWNQGALNANDFDLGAAGALLLPDQPGAHPHLLVSAGKNNTVYLVDRDAMGHYSGTTNDNQVVQSLVDVFPNGTPEPGNYSAPVFFNGTVYFGPVADNIQGFSLSNGRLSTTPQTRSSDLFSYPGAMMAISAAGATNGILWAIQRNGNCGTDLSCGSAAPGVLKAYDPSNLGTLLYSSDQSGSRDTLDFATKFSIPLVANGKVFVGSMGFLTVYGLLP
jgi:uncharacterized repeat protein (TIGR01451 family)